MLEVRNGATDMEAWLLGDLQETLSFVPSSHYLQVDEQNGRTLVSLYRQESRNQSIRVGSVTAGRRIRR